MLSGWLAMTENSSSTVSTTDAIQAMRSRGIDNAESLASCTSPDRIVATCQWWDGRNAGPGLLAMRIKEGGIAPPSKAVPGQSKRQQQIAEFNNIAAPYPEGAVTETHQRLQRRRGYEHDEPCFGRLVVTETPEFPSIMVECDHCGFEAAYPFKALAAGVLPSKGA